MRYLVAVSGGIDSVVLLDMLVKDARHELIVATFDHGIRDDSADDARFVAGLAAKYSLPYVMKREELGAGASEELARRRRYTFLREEAKKHGATIATAHHQDDIIESIAINLTRGTGWRGLAVFDADDIDRPLLHLSKSDIRTYARVNRLEWVEDSTNASTKYLRNRLRLRIKTRLSHDKKQEIIATRKRQLVLKAQIDDELQSYIREDGEYPRYLFIMIDPMTANDLLRSVVMAKSGWMPTRPQADRALAAIKTARLGSEFEIGAGVSLRFTPSTFVVSTQ